MSVPDEGYSRNVSCALNLISTFSFNVAWMVLYQIYVLCWSEILNSRHDGHWLTITTWIRRDFSNTTNLFECKHCMNNQEISDTVPEKPLNCLFAYILDPPLTYHCSPACYYIFHILRHKSVLSEGPSWSWSYGSWIYKCLSPLMLWVRISIRARCTTLCDKVVSFLHQ